VQDELLRQMARLLATDYDTLGLEIIDAEGLGDALTRDPAVQPDLNPAFPIERPTPRTSAAAPVANPSTSTVRPHVPTRAVPPPQPERRRAAAPRPEPDASDGGELTDEVSIVDADSTVPDETEEAPLDDDVPAGTPGMELLPKSGVRDTGSSPNASRHLRTEMLQLATEIGRENSPHLSRVAVNKLIRLIRVARRLLELESTEQSSGAKPD
jgi:hypothetical protein